MITEHDDDQIDRYLNGQLDAAAAVAFEIRLLEEPELLARVQLVEAMKAGLKQQAASLVAPTASATKAKIIPFTAWLRQPLSRAASVLVAALVLHEFLHQLVPARGSAAGSMAVGTVVLLESSRGNVAATFTGPAPYLLQLDVGFGNTADNFTVTVRDSSNVAVTQLNGLDADADGWVRLLVSEPLAGDYEVELAWTDAQGAAQSRRFPINVSP